MGYRIDYQPVRRLHNMERSRYRRGALIGMFLLLFFSGVWHFWPEGKCVLQGLLFSGDIAVTSVALEDFAHQIGSGVTLKTAFAGFCDQILAGG